MKTIEQKSERGSILVVTLLVLAALTVLGLATITLSGMDGEVSINQRAGDQAFYVAEAGIYAGVTAVQADPTLATNNPPLAIPTSYINDGSTNQFFPGTATAAEMRVFVGQPPGGSSVLCGIPGWSLSFGARQFQVLSTGVGPGAAGSQATRQVQAIMQQPPVDGLCPRSTNIQSGGGSFKQ